MKEITDIFKAWQLARQEGKRTALATVVSVEGSSYRRPGARMLVTEDGQLTGAISGGCLEGDALRKALMAIHQQKNKLVTYDTTQDDDKELGVQLGCNGIVKILFEPLPFESDDALIFLLEEVVYYRRSKVLITVYAENHLPQPGTILYMSDDEISISLHKDSGTTEILNLAKLALHNCKTETGSQPDGLQILAHYIPTPTYLLIAGAGNDAKPLASLAASLGWQTTIIDGRPAYATPARFPQASSVEVVPVAGLSQFLAGHHYTACVLMSHNYPYDFQAVSALVQSLPAYVGILGPAKKFQTILSDLEENGIFMTPKKLKSLFGPTGLDLGAETAEEIALSVIAEISMNLKGKSGKSLKHKTTPIHDDASLH